MKSFFLIFTITSAILINSCQWIGQPAPEEPQATSIAKDIPTPHFSASLAMQYTQKQVDFGPRVPGSPGHAACAAWILSELKKFSDTAYFQEFEATTYDQKKFQSKNIIAKINPKNPNRVMLSAHWDTRHVADQDNEKYFTPILGANDGASGVAVILALAAAINSQKIDLGIDIVLFDIEDYGQPENSGLPEMPHSYCLGSQYWAANPTFDFTPKYGVLLDMVGGHNPTFLKEGNSMYSAPQLMNTIWDIAGELGYSSMFRNEAGPQITDDHYYVSSIARIPMIDIIHLNNGGKSSFAHYWHTHDDKMDAVSQASLGAVGEVLVKWLYWEAKNSPSAS